jgi:hypothetical protein
MDLDKSKIMYVTIHMHNKLNYVKCNILSSSLLYEKSKILVVVLYGQKTWSFTLKVKHTLRVFVKRVLRRILGPKQEKVTHSKELHNLCYSPPFTKVIKSQLKNV